MSIRRLLVSLVIILLSQNIAFSQIVINEGSNRNYNAISDEESEYPDWVELYNSGSEAVNLLNYSISDKQSNPTKWVFPEVIIQPGAFLTVFCSGKDRRPDPGFSQVVNELTFTPQIGWNTHFFSTSFQWDGVSSLIVNTCSYNSTGYTSNSVFNQTTTPFLSSVFSYVDGSEGSCTATYGTPVFLRPNMQLNGVTIGTGTVQNGNTSYPAPYGNWYWCARNQMLIQASELIAAGLEPGFITSIAFDVAWTDPNTHYDYIDISLKQSIDTSLTSQFKRSEPYDLVHTNFKISEDGETVYLFSPEQQLLSSLLVECGDLDNSNGSSPDASSNIFLFQTATPGMTNNMSPGYTEYLDSPTFSVASGFFEEPFSVAIINPNEAGSTVHYTTDGSDPTTASPQYNEYPVYIYQSTVLKAKAFANGILPSQSEATTYFFDVDHSTPILSVITENSNLYGPTGIFDNYWTDWEKAAYVEYFDSTKQMIFSQRAGIQMDGGWGGSRTNPQRSFRVEVADGVLGENPVNYPVIPDRPDRTTYSKFYLRNGSNQYLALPYKDACQVTSMCSKANSYYSAYRPVTVYINGSYFGLYELREKFDTEYFETLEGADPDEVTILSQSAWYGGVLRAVEGSVDPFFMSWNTFNTLDPADPGFWEQADNLFDLTYYTDYIIGESWMGNTDWPWNNIKIYRSDVTNYRWRYCIVDQELAMLPNGWTDCNFDHIGYLLGQDPGSPYVCVFLKGIQNERFRNYFINRFADLMNTNYSADRLTSIENTMYSLTFPEMPNEYARWGDPNNIPQQMFAFNSNHLTLRNQFIERSPQVRNHLMSHFNLPNQVDVTLDVFPAESGTVQISTVTPDIYPWQGIYFNGIPVSITAQAAEGFSFSHWLPNGIIADTLNPVFMDTLVTQGLNFTAVFEDETTGNQEINPIASKFTIHPNPASDRLYLSGKMLAGTQYQIVDQFGRSLQSGNILSNESAEIEITSLRPGTYVLQLIGTAGETEKLRFVKIATR